MKKILLVLILGLTLTGCRQDSEEVTTGEASTQEVTTEEATTQEATTEEVTTQEATTEEATTQEATTEEVTTQEATTEEATTQEATTEEVTTQEATTEEVTTQEVTTQEVTTQEVTTEEATTEEVTTESSVDASNALTCDEAINIVESGEGFSEAGFSYSAFKNSDGSYTVKVSSPSIMAGGGSGTLGIYDVFADKTYQLSETNDLSGQGCN